MGVLRRVEIATTATTNATLPITTHLLLMRTRMYSRSKESCVGTARIGEPVQPVRLNSIGKRGCSSRKICPFSGISGPESINAPGENLDGGEIRSDPPSDCAQSSIAS